MTVGLLSFATMQALGLSSRNVINLNNFSSITNEYPTIDHIPSGSNTVGPISGTYSTGTVWPGVIDANGWQNSNSNTGDYGGGFIIPDPTNYGGPYIMDLPLGGNGQVIFSITLPFGSVATWTTASPVNCSVTFNSGGSLQITSTGGASAASIQISLTCTGTGPQSISFKVQNTGGSGFFIKKVRWYRSADATDLANGLYWRSAWKQPLVNLCPSAIRCMNNIGSNADRNCRFENRTLPSNAGWTYAAQWGISPVYATDATGNNQMVVAAATPTTANTKTTTASMVHGEVATYRIPSTGGGRRCTNNQTVGVISNATNGVVTIASNPIGLFGLSWSGGTVTGTMFTSHSEDSRFTVGDTVQLLIASASPAGYNGTFSCTITAISPGSSVTFTYPLASNPGAYVGGATYDGHGYNTGDIIGHYFNPVENISATLSSSINVTVNNGSSVVNGMFVYGPGIPANTTVLSGGGTNALVLSNAATFSGGINIAFRSMQNLHLFPCTITVNGPLTYQLNVDTTGMGTFSTNSSCFVFSYQFQTLQVGSGSDRTAYPCTSGSGLPYSQFGNFIAPSTYKTAYFDKNLSSQTDGSGNYIMGVWKLDSAPQSLAAAGDMPIEFAVALVNELNAMSPAHTIGLWINIPVWGLTSMDPDYTTASDWAINCMDVILNPSSTVRANGYSALGYSGASKLNSPVCIIEYSNENWNNTDQRGWLQAAAIRRWPTIYPYQNYQDLQALRSTVIARSIKAANPPNLSQCKFVLGMFGTQGMGNNGLSANYAVAFGGTVTANPALAGDWYTNDSLVTGGSWGRPIDNHDGVCPATYFDPPDVYYSGLIGTGSFVDDSAMFNGTNNSAATISWTATISGSTMTVTGSPSATINIGQLFSGAGVTAGTQVTGNASTGGGFTGSGGAGTYGLNKSSTVASPITMSNAGGNYTGAANQSQAITNFVAQVVDANNIYQSETTTRYGTVIMPQFAAQIPAGKVVLNYEGGTDWQTQAGNNQGGHILTAGDSTFSIAVINSSQWATAQTNFFNTVNAVSKCFMPSVYIWVGAVGTERWSYCTPDTYATITGTPTEGAALTVNSPVWIAMGNRNQALPS